MRLRRDAVSSPPTAYGRRRFGAPHPFAVGNTKGDQPARFGSSRRGIGNRKIQLGLVRGPSPLNAPEGAAYPDLCAPQLPAAQRVQLQGRSDLAMNLAGALGGAVAGPLLAVLGYAGLAWTLLLPITVVLAVGSVGVRRSRPQLTA